MRPENEGLPPGQRKRGRPRKVVAPPPTPAAASAPAPIVEEPRPVGRPKNPPPEIPPELLDMLNGDVSEPEDFVAIVQKIAVLGFTGKMDKGMSLFALKLVAEARQIAKMRKNAGPDVISESVGMLDAIECDLVTVYRETYVLPPLEPGKTPAPPSEGELPEEPPVVLAVVFPTAAEIEADKTAPVRVVRLDPKAVAAELSRVAPPLAATV